jgi:hypothetical protein
MAKVTYYDKPRKSKANLELLDTINKIIDEYLTKGYKLTLRQLYYQLVSRDIIPNKGTMYHKLSTLLKDDRMMGLVDWNSIEDRIRVPKIPYCSSGVYQTLHNAAWSHRLDRLEDQDTYIEVWAEKDALSGIIYNVTRDYHINLMINRGYSSCTAMYDASSRLFEQMNQGKNCVILYLGDHDPSGEDMVRDIGDRLQEFGVCDATIKKIGLTYEQVQMYNSPPNPAKVTDPRAKDYIALYGPVSWEVDALKPEILDDILRTEIESCIDLQKYEARKEEEAIQKKILYDFAEEYKNTCER